MATAHSKVTSNHIVARHAFGGLWLVGGLLHRDGARCRSWKVDLAAGRDTAIRPNRAISVGPRHRDNSLDTTMASSRASDTSRRHRERGNFAHAPPGRAPRKPRRHRIGLPARTIRPHLGTAVPAGRPCPLVGRARWSAVPAGRPCPLVGRARWSAVPAGRPCPLVGRARWSAVPAGRPRPLVGRARWSAAPAGRPRPLVGRARRSAMPASRPRAASPAATHRPHRMATNPSHLLAREQTSPC
ncbi:hypothetical protein SAMN06264365_102303 [Actinoplanes regularis]|uniref:Uncharacterized protein n=1 Tax=Actinoplanes regularis TaxID=52697 RepID=A0A238W9E1_9ACTN|nr:hypothetical protein SAMN06264365_102303 [Actinoplanes regularis]